MTLEIPVVIQSTKWRASGSFRQMITFDNQNAQTIIVAAVTSVIKKRYLPSHIILGEKFGLKKPSSFLNGSGADTQSIRGFA